MNDRATLMLREIVLQRLPLRRQAQLSPRFLETARPEVHVDYVTDRLLLALKADVLGRAETETLTIVEEPVYPTWRHHLVASLPNGFRRRFLTYLWFPDEPLARRITHTVTAHARAAFPDAAVPEASELGRPVYVAAIYADEYAEDVGRPAHP